MRILRDVIFNEAEMTISINIRSLPEKATIFTTSTKSTKTTEIIENIPNVSDTDIADTNDANIIFENIEDAPFENITIESALVRRSIRHRKATFKVIGVNAVAANTIGVAETFIISANKKKSEKEDYLSKAIIAKLSITNENKLTYEKAIIDLKEFQ
jgi:hypothetical protein